MTEVLPETPHPGNGHQTPNALATPPQNMVPGVSPALAPAHAPVHQGTHPGTHGGAPSPAHRGREKLHWGKEVWDRLDHAVHKEIERTRVAAKFLPHHRVPPHTTSVPADIVIVPTPGPSPLLQVTGADGGLVPPTVIRGIPLTSPPPTANTFAVDEGATTRLIEFWVEFALTPQQAEQEANLTHDHQGASHPVHPAHAEHGHSGHSEHGHLGQSTAVTLATRAANILAQAEDMLMFDGLGAFTSPLYTNYVRWRANGEPLDWGLLEVIPALAPPLPPGLSPLPAAQVITVPQKPPPTTPGQPPSLYGENTFQAVTEGYATLMGNGQYGPFALTLHNVPYADSFAPLPDTLIMPADRIAPLMTAGFRDSGTLDAPGATAAAAGAAAAAAVIAAAGGPPASAATQAAAQQAAAQAAAGYAIDYGITVGLAAPVAVAATTAATAAVAAGAPGGPIPAGQPGGPAPFVAPSAGPPANAMFLGVAAAISAAQAALKAFPAFPVSAGFPDPTKLTPAPSGLPSYYGSLVSLGGNAMDLVVGIEPTVGFMQQDVDGNFRFRVVERVALRLKDITAVVRLEFQ
jgi:hypothetical protein